MGVEMYSRALVQHGKPEDVAKKLQVHGVSRFWLFAVWQEQRLTRQPNRLVIGEYAEACRSLGISVGIWGYPWGGREEEFIEQMKLHADLAGAKSVLLDPEIGYKWAGRRRLLGGMRGVQGEATPALTAHKPSGTESQRREQASRLMDLALAQFPNVGLTSYGMAHWHPNFPWSQFCTRAHWLSPQLYTSNIKDIVTACAQWRLRAAKETADIRPSVAAFGPMSGAKMDQYLSGFVHADQDISSVIVWDYSHVRGSEWESIERFGAALRKGKC